MSKAKVYKKIVGMVATNCYFLVNTETGEGIIIDPGDDAPVIRKQVADAGMKPVAILLTHGHFDHIMAADEIRQEYKIPIIAYEKEKDLLENTSTNLSTSFGRSYKLKADRFVTDEEVMEIAGFTIRVLFTPGHTEGGCCYYLPDEGIVFSGDSLFCQSIGRTDFPTGSMSTLIHAIREKLLVLPDETKVYPGHDCSTDIGSEKENNPFL